MIDYRDKDTVMLSRSMYDALKEDNRDYKKLIDGLNEFKDNSDRVLVVKSERESGILFKKYEFSGGHEVVNQVVESSKKTLELVNEVIELSKNNLELVAETNDESKKILVYSKVVIIFCWIICFYELFMTFLRLNDLYGWIK